MDISLTKLPWYGQIGAFVALSLTGVGLFYYYDEEPARSEVSARELTLKALRADVAKGQATEKKLPEFRTQVGELEERLASLRQAIKIQGPYPTKAMDQDWHRIGADL